MLIGKEVIKGRKISSTRDKQDESLYKHSSSRSYKEKNKNKDHYRQHRIKTEKIKDDFFDREMGSAPPLKRYRSSSGDKLPLGSEQKGRKDLGTLREDHYDYEKYSDRHELKNKERRSAESESQGYRRSSKDFQRHNETDIQHPSMERRMSRDHDEWETSTYSERRSDFREDDSYHSKDRDNRRLSTSSKDFVTVKPYAKEGQYISSNKSPFQEIRDMRAVDDHSRSRKSFEIDSTSEQPYAEEDKHPSGRKTYQETRVIKALDEEHITEDERYYSSMKREHENNSSKDYGERKNSRRISESDFIVCKDTAKTPAEQDLMKNEAYIRGTHSRNQMFDESYGNVEGYEGFRRDTDMHSATAESGTQRTHYNFPDKNKHGSQELSPEKEKPSDFYDYGHEQPRQYRNKDNPFETEDFGGNGQRTKEVSQNEYDYQDDLISARGRHSGEEYQHSDEIMPMHDKEGMPFSHRRGNKFTECIDHTDEQHFEPDYQGPMDQQRYEADPEQMHEDFQEKYPSGKSVVLFVEICYALM